MTKKGKKYRKRYKYRILPPKMRPQGGERHHEQQGGQHVYNREDFDAADAQAGGQHNYAATS